MSSKRIELVAGKHKMHTHFQKFGKVMALRRWVSLIVARDSFGENDKTSSTAVFIQVLRTQSYETWHHSDSFKAPVYVL
jgi:hypothetical protein